VYRYTSKLLYRANCQRSSIWRNWNIKYNYREVNYREVSSLNLKNGQYTFNSSSKYADETFLRDWKRHFYNISKRLMIDEENKRNP
jgi:hypothetical protein